jgi:hypothetical protein
VIEPMKAVLAREPFSDPATLTSLGRRLRELEQEESPYLGLRDDKPAREVVREPPR